MWVRPVSISNVVCQNVVALCPASGLQPFCVCRISLDEEDQGRPLALSFLISIADFSIGFSLVLHVDHSPECLVEFSSALLSSPPLGLAVRSLGCGSAAHSVFGALLPRHLSSLSGREFHVAYWQIKTSIMQERAWWKA